MISCGFHLKLLVPVAFEVDGIDQHQAGQRVQHTLGQQILYFTCEFKAQISHSAPLLYYLVRSDKCKYLLHNVKHSA